MQPEARSADQSTIKSAADVINGKARRKGGSGKGDGNQPFLVPPAVAAMSSGTVSNCPDRDLRDKIANSAQPGFSPSAHAIS